MSKRYEVKWQETRVIKVYAVVNADSPEEAVKKAQGYDIDEGANEYLEEHESHTDEIHRGKATETEE